MGVRGIEAPLTTAPIVNHSRQSPIIPCGQTMPEESTPEELAALEADDAYLDALGSGLDVPDEPLNRLRAGDAGYVDWSRFPSAAIARGEVPPAPTTGGTLSISENAAQLAALAGSTAERGAVQQAIQGVEDLRAQAMNLLGSNAAQAATVGGAAEAARAALETADGMVAMLLAAISDAASYHGG